ncbi:MAG: DUF1540 domain-containing protein [Peptostreptococcales bacterium]
MSRIVCRVASCAYFNNNACTADEIEVENQNNSFSNSSEETLCNTFKPRKNSNNNRSGISNSTSNRFL